MAHDCTTALRNQISIAVKFWPQYKKTKLPTQMSGELITYLLW